MLLAGSWQAVNTRVQAENEFFSLPESPGQGG